MTFNSQAAAIGATLPQIGTLSDYALTGAQTDELARVRAGTATGSLTGRRRQQERLWEQEQAGLIRY